MGSSLTMEHKGESKRSDPADSPRASRVIAFEKEPQLINLKTCISRTAWALGVGPRDTGNEPMTPKRNNQLVSLNLNEGGRRLEQRPQSSMQVCAERMQTVAGKVAKHTDVGVGSKIGKPKQV